MRLYRALLRWLYRKSYGPLRADPRLPEGVIYWAPVGHIDETKTNAPDFFRRARHDSP